MPTPRFDSPEIHRAIDLLLHPNQVYELRVFSSCWATVRGYYTDYERLAWAAGYMNSRAPAVYLTLNPVARDLLARSANRLVKYARETTSDFDILVRRWLPRCPSYHPCQLADRTRVLVYHSTWCTGLPHMTSRSGNPKLERGQAWVLARCPWNGHEDYAGYIVSSPSGAIAAGCHHNSCQVKGLASFRRAMEGGLC